MPLLHCLRICGVSALQELARVRNLSTVDVAAVRLWLDKRVQPETASNVMAGFDPGVGATFFDLNTLQVRMHQLHAHTHSNKYLHILYHPCSAADRCACVSSTIEGTMPASTTDICQLLDQSCTSFCRFADASSPSILYIYVPLHSALQAVKITLIHLPPSHFRPMLM